LEIEKERNEKEKYKTKCETNERIHVLEKQKLESQIQHLRN